MPPPPPAPPAPLGERDLPAIVALHVRAFRDDLRRDLGAVVVRRYYERVLAHPALVVRHGLHDAAGTLRAYLFGYDMTHPAPPPVGEHASLYAALLLRRPWHLLHRATRARARTAAKLVYLRVRRPHPTRPAIAAQPVPTLFLEVLAVDPAVQGQGYASHLLRFAITVAQARGAAALWLGVQPFNHRALVLYERLGWQRVTHGGVWLNKMVRPIPNAAPHTPPVGNTSDNQS